MAKKFSEDDVKACKDILKPITARMSKHGYKLSWTKAAPNQDWRNLKDYDGVPVFRRVRYSFNIGKLQHSIIFTIMLNPETMELRAESAIKTDSKSTVDASFKRTRKVDQDSQKVFYKENIQNPKTDPSEIMNRISDRTKKFIERGLDEARKGVAEVEEVLEKFNG